MSKGAPVLTIVKRGIAFKAELQTRVYELARLAHVSENRVIVRMLQIARDVLAGFDDPALRRVLRDPWHEARKLPALASHMREHAPPRLTAVTAARLGPKDKQALRALAKKHSTTMSGLQRNALSRLLQEESS
jgi:hypothetical protein